MPSIIKVAFIHKTDISAPLIEFFVETDNYCNAEDVADLVFQQDTKRYKQYKVLACANITVLKVE